MHRLIHHQIWRSPRVALLARLLVTGLLVALLLATVDLRQLSETLRTAEVSWLLLGGAITLVSMLCAAARWHLLIADELPDQSFGVTARVTFASTFFSMFLPSAIGGDVMKVVLLAPPPQRRAAVISSVLLDRVVGLAVTLAVAALAVALLPQTWSNSGLLLALACTSAGFVVAVVVLFSRRLTNGFGKLLPVSARPFAAKAAQLRDALHAFKDRPGVLWSAAALSLARQVLICLASFCGGLAFQIPLGLLAYFALIPLAMAIITLPLSINGIGLQDNALVLLFGALGVPPVLALSLSLYQHALSNGVGLLGGVIWLLGRRSPVTAPAQPADR